jgi:uncharacterized protein
MKGLNMEHQAVAIADCDLKFAESEGSFSGYGSVFGNVDTKKDIILPGAYDEVLKSGNPVPIYVNHGWLRGDLPVGNWDDLKQDTRGLFGAASLVMKMPAAVNAYWAMKSGLATGLSVAIIPDHKTVERRADGVRMIHSVKMLKEISVVTDPANTESRVVSVKSDELIAQMADIKSIRDLEYFLRDAGGFSKGAVQALTACVKDLFSQRDAAEQAEAKALAEMAARAERLAKSIE